MTSWTRLYRDDRIFGSERYILTAEPRELMDIPQEVLKSVVFVGYEDLAGNPYFGGSAVLISRARIAGKLFTYLVTAKHVIDEIKDKGIDCVMLRMNLKSGNAKWFPTRLKDWVMPSDKSLDVAVLPYNPTDQIDHFPFPIFRTLDPGTKERFNVGVGNDVFITGLFHPHAGKQNNIPIVRIGNIAAMPTEQIAVKKFGLIDAYLIEARSIGGLSGSPVFLSLGASRSVGGFFIGEHAQIILLGIVHGHFDAEEGTTKTDAADTLTEHKINMGIAIVVPIEKVLDTILQSEIASKEDEVIKKEAEQNLPTMDSGSLPAEEEPFTKSDFEQALRKVSRRVEPSESDAGKK